MRHSVSMGYNKMLPSLVIHCQYKLKFLAISHSSSLTFKLKTLISLITACIGLMPACIGSVHNYRNPIQCAYHSVISLLLSGNLWSHLWNKSRTKLDETSDKLAIFACNDSFQSKLKQVTTQSNNSLVMMEWCRLAPTWKQYTDCQWIPISKEK